jgi:hypothetical protein
MTLSEPTTLASNGVLAAVAVALAGRLHRAGPERRPQRLWAAAFLVGATAALAGGVVHGFAASLSPFAHDLLWKIVLVGAGLAGSLILAGAVLASLGGSWRAALLAGAAGQLAVYLGLVSGSNDIRLAVGNGAATIVALLALTVATATHDRRRLVWILLALALSAAGLVAQRTGLTAAVLNHNDVCHLLQTAALWPFYRAGLRLREPQLARGPVGGPDRRPEAP